MGTIRLKKALEILAGPAYQMKVNHVSREVTFKLKDEYNTSLEDIDIGKYRTIWQERLANRLRNRD